MLTIVSVHDGRHDTHVNVEHHETATDAEIKRAAYVFAFGNEEGTETAVIDQHCAIVRPRITVGIDGRAHGR